MTADRELSLAHHFAELTDPRIDRTRLHDLLDIVAIAICAVIAGAESWDDIEDFGNVKHDWLKTFLALPNGIPSHEPSAASSSGSTPMSSSDLSSVGSRRCMRPPSGRSSPSTARPSGDRSTGPRGSRPSTWSTPGPRRTTSCWARWPWMRSPTRSPPFPCC